MSPPFTLPQSAQPARPIRPTLEPLTSLSSSSSEIIPVPEFQLNQGQNHKSLRSYSVSSSISTTSTNSNSSTYSRAADDMIDRLAMQDSHSIIDLWSGGNIRLNGRDLTSTARDAEDLLHAMKVDERFEFVKLTFFDADGEDWKISFKRTSVILSSPVISDSE
ncbi:uncharacterized protein I303_108648 [Kwoniella dejecticola CBS 10117]|uniref:Uncharacterized protein n=1 Tax=Kwoniella dejecticola CBS 10117 TaxID=1296121 RepID=A0A1A5ZWU0_9TREE|nr:uncharacterized protein I303_07027 [Kwoniella dejecticola CBS 10117]OBR82268.1 hypothetical protein I303_07027 [Kwoniella dejecticola CBS 10117]